MDPEKQQESGNPNVTEKVTDEELQSALDAVLNEAEPAEEAAPEGDTPETPEETPPEAESAPQGSQETPPPPEEPTDPRERSALGRKVKELGLEIQRLQMELQARKAGPPSTQTPDDETPEFITTPDELEKYLEIRERKRATQEKGYEIGYSQRFLEIGKDDPLYDDIEKEMMANFNTKQTGKPSIDAELNYHRAKAAVLTKRLATPPPAPPAPPRIPGKGEKPQGTGVTVASRNARPASAPPVLDEFASEFVRRTKMSEDSVRSALGASKPRR